MLADLLIYRFIHNHYYLRPHMMPSASVLGSYLFGHSPFIHSIHVLKPQQTFLYFYHNILQTIFQTNFFLNVQSKRTFFCRTLFLLHSFYSHYSSVIRNTHTQKSVIKRRFYLLSLFLH